VRSRRSRSPEVAYAADGTGDADTTVTIVEDGSGAGGSAVDCPEKNGGGDGSAPAQENL
jgi:hypothetical protein